MEFSLEWQKNEECGFVVIFEILVLLFKPQSGTLSMECSKPFKNHPILPIIIMS